MLRRLTEVLVSVDRLRDDLLLHLLHDAPLPQVTAIAIEASRLSLIEILLSGIGLSPLQSVPFHQLGSASRRR